MSTIDTFIENTLLSQLAADLEQATTDVERMEVFADSALQQARQSGGDPIVSATYFAAIGNFERARADYQRVVLAQSLVEATQALDKPPVGGQ